jgi:hypothetical protein
LDREQKTAVLSGMTLVRIVVLVVFLFSIYLGWSLSRGHVRGVRLYFVAVAVPLSLVGAAAAQLAGIVTLVEPLNVIALALSLGALPGGPSVWEGQVQSDLERTRLYRTIEPADLLSWKAWLKLVDRLGAPRAALGYLGVFAVALIVALLAVITTTQTVERAFALAPLAAPGLFAVLSTVWLYRAARRLIPNA